MADLMDGDLKARVLKVAEEALGNDPAPGADHCAIFVRACFTKAGYPLPETKNPSDLAICRQSGYPLAPSYANSLAGDEIGRKLPMADAQPGDLVFFNNVGNYGSKFTQGTIVHVGICVGDKMMINHGDSLGAYKAAFSDYAGPTRWQEARRPKLFDIPRTRIRIEKGKVTQSLRNNSVHKLDVVVSLSTSGAMGMMRTGVGKLNLPGIAGGLQVSVNQSPVHHYKAVWLRVNDIASGESYKLSYQHGHTAASVNGRPLSDLKCEMKSSGGALHVRVNDKEVRTHDAVIDIVYVS